MKQKIQVLQLEDSPRDAALIQKTLAAGGFSCEFVVVDDEVGFNSALAGEPFDLILSDYNLPGYDGLAAVQLAHDLRPATPVIVISGTVGEDVAVQCLHLGASDYLLKDRLARLGSAVHRALEEARRCRERQQVQADLRTTHAQLRQFLENSPAVIYALRLEGSAILPYLISENLTELLGFKVAEAMSYDWWTGQLHPEDRERAIAGIRETLEQGASRTEYRLRHKDGCYRWVEDNRRLVRDELNRPNELVGLWTNITGRKLAEIELERTHRELVESSRQIGMAEVATGILHNVGNVLNSVNVGSACLADSLKKSKGANLAKVVALLREHEADLGAYVSSDPKGKLIPDFLAQLADCLAEEQAVALKELDELQKNIQHINEIVSLQQNSAGVSGLAERVKATDLVEDALKLNASSLSRRDIQILKEFEEVPSLVTQKHKVLQILVNLIRNAEQSCDQSGHSDNRLTLRVARSQDGVIVSVGDNGVGINAENLARIFAHGFTTKKDGHGFGLHSAALAAKELGGSLTADSDGLGRGARFVLELPLEPSGH